MNLYVLLVFVVVFIILIVLGLRYPNVRSDWKYDARSTARILITVLATVLLFFLLWYFLGQQKLPDIVITATYSIFILIGALLVTALILKK